MGNGTGLTCNEEMEEQCFSEPCQQALQAFTNANAQVAVDCQKLQNAVSQRNAWAAAVAGCLVAFTTFIIASGVASSTFFGTIVGIVLFAIAMVFAALVITFSVFLVIAQIEVNNDQATVTSDQRTVQADLLQVQQNCPICCQPTLTVSACGQGAG